MSAETSRVTPPPRPARPILVPAGPRSDVFIILLGFAHRVARHPDLPHHRQYRQPAVAIGACSASSPSAQFLVVVSGGFDLVGRRHHGDVVAGVRFQCRPRRWRLLRCSPLALAAPCGLFNGLVITKGRVQPLIATLAMMGIARGLALSISEKSILVSDPGHRRAPRLRAASSRCPPWSGSRSPSSPRSGSPPRGQALHVFAVGGNEQTARLAGVPVDRVKIGVYTASGLLSGLTGIVLVIRSSSGVPLGGMGWELDTIAAIVIGGTNLFGGEGRLLRAMAGVLVYQMIANVMNLSGVDPFYQDIVRAAVIVVAVGLSMLRQRRAGRRILQRGRA